jgi:hypothetical protein
MARYPRAIKPNHGLDVANCYVANLGAPALADVDRFVVSTNMKNGSYTLAATTSPDGQARNVTVTRTSVTGDDTAGTVTVTGTNTAGAVISEVITPGASGVTVAGVKAFKTVTSVVGAGWVINTGNDTITVGFGGLVGLPWAIRQAPAVSAATDIFLVLLNRAVQAATIVWDADEIEKCTIDASAGTFNGTKILQALILR